MQVFFKKLKEDRELGSVLLIKGADWRSRMFQGVANIFWSRQAASR